MSTKDRSSGTHRYASNEASSDAEENVNVEKSPPKKNSIVILILSLLVIITGGLAIYFYRQLSTAKQNPQAIAQQEINTVVARVGQLMVLPNNEQPTLATVADLTKLKDQPFFAHAKVGDKVLLYNNARKVILYDPVANKIVEVAPLNVGDGQTAAPSAPTPEQKTGQ